LITESRVSLWLWSYAACALIGGSLLVLLAAFGGEGHATWGQLAIVFFVVGPLAGIPVLILAAAVYQRSFVGTVGALGFLVFAAYWGFGIGR
jgi:hypothetical protein